MDKEKELKKEKKTTKAVSKTNAKNKGSKKNSKKTTADKKTEKTAPKSKKITKIEVLKPSDEKKIAEALTEVKENIAEDKEIIVPQPVKQENIKQDELKTAQITENVKLVAPEAKQETKSKDNSFSLVEVIGLLVASIIISLAIGIVLGNGYSSKKSLISTSTTDEIIRNYNYIKEEYPDASEEELLNGAIEGMLKVLNDPYAALIESDSNFNIEINGTYEGLGLQITTMQTGEIFVSKVFENSGADKAGIKVGDQLIKLDNLELSNKTGSDFATYVKNTNKSSFEVTLIRENEEITCTVEKKTIDIVSVHENIIEQNNKKIGYLKVDIFSGTTYKQFKDKLSKLEENNIDSLIIDLRGNSGGMLSTVTDMLSLMLDSSKIMYKTDNDGDIETFYSNGKKSKEYEIVVLIDGESASASEIMASALKDNLNAKLVGTKSYGKGTVQQVKTLSSGAEYKITTKKWLTPSGECIDGKGIEPDYNVLLDENYYNNPSDETDNQLNKAIELLK